MADDTLIQRLMDEIMGLVHEVMRVARDIWPGVPEPDSAPLEPAVTSDLDEKVWD